MPCTATSQLHPMGSGADSAPRRFLHHTLHPLPLSLELHHGEMLPSSFWIKGPGVGGLHRSGRGWSSEISGLERCKGCMKVCSRYHKPSWLSLSLMFVRCVLRPRQPSLGPCKTAAWDSTQTWRAPSSGCLFPCECFTAQGSDSS